MIQILDAQFVTTAVEPAGYPKGGMPEVAFVGRSNVGKSSMINALAGRRKLVRVSNTPGRTRTLNFFDITLLREEEKAQIRLADLPGYGFAKASKSDRTHWKEMIDTYLHRRGTLGLVVSIIDAEIGPSNEDVQTLEYLASANRKILIAATKIDRIPKAKRKPRLLTLANQLEIDPSLIVAFSAVEKIGIQELWDTVLGVLL